MRNLPFFFPFYFTHSHTHQQYRAHTHTQPGPKLSLLLGGESPEAVQHCQFGVFFFFYSVAHADPPHWQAKRTLNEKGGKPVNSQPDGSHEPF